MFYPHLQKSKERIINHKKIPYGKVRKGNKSHNWQFLVQKWSKIVQREKVNLGVLANHHAVHSGVVSGGKVRCCGCCRY